LQRIEAPAPPSPPNAKRAKEPKPKKVHFIFIFLKSILSDKMFCKQKESADAKTVKNKRVTALQAKQNKTKSKQNKI
jgi:hypothetical protein